MASRFDGQRDFPANAYKQNPVSFRVVLCSAKPLEYAEPRARVSSLAEIPPLGFPIKLNPTQHDLQALIRPVPLTCWPCVCSKHLPTQAATKAARKAAKKAAKKGPQPQPGGKSVSSAGNKTQGKDGNKPDTAGGHARKSSRPTVS